LRATKAHLCALDEADDFIGVDNRHVKQKWTKAYRKISFVRLRQIQKHNPTGRES
jgi:hypothetical protein